VVFGLQSTLDARVQLLQEKEGNVKSLRRCCVCRTPFKIDHAGPEAMRGDGSFPPHVCPKCATPTSIAGLPVVQNAVVREFLDALEALHRCGLLELAAQPTTALSPAGARLKAAYIALRCVPKEPSEH
jgi:hypothetical protein